MTKRSLNDTVFSIQGIHPGFTARDESNNIPPQQSTGKVVLKKFVCCSKDENKMFFLFVIDNNF
jgi:hypothetical protein